MSNRSDPNPLLADDEPPPVATFRLEGRAPVLLLCDHASRRVPRALAYLGLPATAFDRHIEKTNKFAKKTIS